MPVAIIGTEGTQGQVDPGVALYRGASKGRGTVQSGHRQQQGRRQHVLCVWGMIQWAKPSESLGPLLRLSRWGRRRQAGVFSTLVMLLWPSAQGYRSRYFKALGLIARPMPNAANSVL